jgi:selenide,water dikinase
VPDARVLVGTDTADDAGVFKLTGRLALVQTVDLLAPVVDDPYTFGRIAAVNSMSDVYAMGGRPLCALNVVGYPGNGDPKVLGEMLKGGQDAVVEAGAAVVGGHTFQSEEVKYGLSVTGEVDPNRVVTNCGTKPGDRLVLTKPLGGGVLTQALMDRGTLPGEIYEKAVATMLQSNRLASELMLKYNAHACTDITGFGFIGHCWEMTGGDGGLGIEIDHRKLPVTESALELIRDGTVNSGVKMNRNSFETHVRFEDNVPSEYQSLLFTSETSGGLLVALDPEAADEYVDALQKSGAANAAIIGEVKKNLKNIVNVK